MEKELSFDTFRITNDFLCKTNPKMFYTNCEQKTFMKLIFHDFFLPFSEKSKFWSNKKVCILLKIILSLSLFLFTSKREEQYHTKVDFGIPLIFNNTFCIPENYNSNISQQLFDYKLPLWIYNTRTQIQKRILYSKTCLNIRLKMYGIQK